jgi:hypothetical protein
MNTLNTLSESLYDLSFFNRLYRYILDNFNGVSIKSSDTYQLDITKYFPEHLLILRDKNGVPRKTYKIFFQYIYIKNSKYTQPSCFLSDNNSIVIEMDAGTPFYKLIKNLDSPTFRDIMKHEVVHALDILRDKAYLDLKDTDTKDSNKLLLAKHPSIIWKDEQEFNQFFHAIARYKSQHKIAYDKINDLDDIFDIIDSPKYGLVAMKSTKSMRHDPKLRKEILKRLARENLLPLGLRSKI